MVTTRPDGALVHPRVQPRAARNEIVAWARLAAVVAVALLWAAPASADHLTLNPAARPLAAPSLAVPPLPVPPFDADVNVGIDGDGFHVGGRLLGFGQTLGAWLRGRFRDGGVTLDGQLNGHRTFNFRLDADSMRPSIKIEITPGTL